MKLDFRIKVLFIGLFFLPANVFASPCDFSCYYSRPCGFYGGITIGFTQLQEPSLPISLVPGDVNAVLSSVPGTTLSSPGFSFSINSISLNSLAINSFNTSQSNNLLGGSLFVGYKFYEYFALEGGVGKTQNFSNSYSSNINAAVSGSGTFTGSGLLIPASFAANFVNLNRSETINTSWLYLIAKAILPVSQSFDVFAKLGYTFLWQKANSQITIQNLTNIVITLPPPLPLTATAALPPGTIFSISETSNRRKAYPIIGLGGSYYFGCASTVDVAWTRIIVNTNSKDNNVNFYGIGVTTFF